MRYCIAASMVVSLLVAAPAWAAPPDLTGMYVKEALPEGGGRPRDEAPYTPAARADQARDRGLITTAGLLTNMPHTKCLPPGMPAMMQPPYGIEFIQSPGRLTVIAEVSNLPRTIYMNLKEHPEGIDPGWNGHSIGRWEGKTLIVDTVGFNGRAPNVSTKMHMVEKIYLTKDGKTLVDEITMDDPEVFTKAHTITFRYTKLAATEPLMEYFCEVIPESMAAVTAAEKALAGEATARQAAK